MLPTIILAFSGVAAAFVPEAAPHLFARQTFTASVNTLDPCYTKVSSAAMSTPTLPPKYQEWLSSARATKTDECDTLSEPATFSDVNKSWRSAYSDWIEENTSMFESILSECSSFINSQNDAIMSSMREHDMSCYSRSTATRSRSSSSRSARPSATDTGIPSATATTTASETVTESVAATETATVTTGGETSGTSTSTDANATQSESSGVRGVSLAGYASGMLAVSLSMLYVL